MLQLELTSFDTILEHTRTRNNAVERNLLASITERGILDSIQVAWCSKAGSFIILDGFKRYRYAKKLKMGTIPAV
jgi:ParB-like chromosome segregation protein Spo0J